MRITNRSAVAVLVFCGFLGCAGPESGPKTLQNAAESYQPGPKVGTTFNSVKADLTALMVGSGRTVYVRHPENPLAPRTFFVIDSVDVKQDRLEVNILQHGVRTLWCTLYYETLAEGEISVKNGVDKESDLSIIKVPGSPWSFVSFTLASTKRLGDDLFFLQQGARADSAGNPALALTPEFEALAANYRAAAVKPQVTEEQRRYIVQANALGQQKDYTGALEIYGKALAVDPVAYPEAYFNMALLSVEKGRYRSAISLMKKYLLLAPGAKDARAAQDKIYEWEILMQKK
jgi:hypothetical protein